MTVTASNPFKFFSNALQGKVSCLRFTDHALASTQFLRASSREVDKICQPDVVAFYTFRDGEPGTDASTSTLCNDVAPWLASGSITIIGAAATSSRTSLRPPPNSERRTDWRSAATSNDAFFVRFIRSSPVRIF